MKVTIEINVPNASAVAMADEAHALLPTSGEIKGYLDATKQAVLPVTFRAVNRQRQSVNIIIGD